MAIIILKVAPEIRGFIKLSTGRLAKSLHSRIWPSSRFKPLYHWQPFHLWLFHCPSPVHLSPKTPLLSSQHVLAYSCLLPVASKKVYVSSAGPTQAKFHLKYCNVSNSVLPMLNFGALFYFKSHLLGCSKILKANSSPTSKQESRRSACSRTSHKKNH